MPQVDLSLTLSFSTPEELALWLKEHHSHKSELWITIFKKKTGIPSVTWDDVVIEALCWGWIDGTKKSLNDKSYLQRISPRRPGSRWSKRNRAHAERLIAEERMTSFGLMHVNAAKNDGRWDNAYAASQIVVPDDFLAELDSMPKEKQFFETLSKSSRYVIAHGLESAKKAETRKKRFKKFMDMLTQETKP
jgi:uncharacterized protein YdeI (YjbR/CyaY-like superfamily)